MKRLISLSMTLLIAVNIYAVTLYTPNGKAFQTTDGNHPSYDADWFEAWIANNLGSGNPYPNSEAMCEWEDGLWEYNCHVFGWNNWQGAERWSSESDMWKLGKPSPYNLMWRSYPDVWYTDSDNPIGIVSYISSASNEAAICTYSGNHSARIVGNGNRFISKWGSLPIVKHPPTEVPIGYGSVNAYYKINPAYRPVGDGDPAGRDWETISNALSGITNGSLVAVLSGTQTLSENISIPSGVTLKTNSGTTVILNGYYIKCTGSGKIIKNGTITGYTSYAQSGSDYKGFFPSSTTIQQILGWASSGWNITLASGTYNNSDNLTVNSGITLTINSGVTLKFAAGKKLTINGTLSAQGTSGNRITFQSISGTWYGIELNYCSSTTLKYCTIQDASYGVHAYDTPLYVENCTITNNYNGISYDNFSSGYVKNSTISYCYGGCGINCSQYSDPTLKPYNRIWNNTPSGVYGDDNSIPELGTTYNHGNNSIKNNYPDEVWSDNSNTVYAQYNYWGSSSPDPSVSENVVWEPYLTSDPTGGGLLKPFADDLDVNDPFTHTVNDTIGKSQFDKAYQVYLSGDYAAAINLFDQLVNKYPENHTGLQSLALIDNCYQNLDNVTASSNYLNQIATTYAGKEISGLAKSIAVGHLVKSGDYDVAIGYSQQILTEFVDKVIAKYALYDLGTIYWYFKEDYATGEQYYRQLIAAYPDDDLSISALATLGEWKPGEPKLQPPLTQNQAEVKEFSLDHNYPNPFNPETTIRYHLAEASPVTIKIYNLLGEEVITLLDQTQLQGVHAVQWNGRDRFGSVMANGVYWVRMQAEKFVAQRKLIILR